MFKRMAGGSEKALEQIWKTYGNSLHKKILLIVRDDALAQEVLSDVFEALWKNRKKVAAMDNPPGWLHRTAQYKAIDKMKQEGRRLTMPLPPGYEAADPQTPEVQMDERETMRNLRQAIEKLPPQAKKVFLLSIGGMKRLDIAVLLKLSENTIKKHLSLARKALRPYLHLFKLLL